jgi:hypothetical protein
MEANVHFLIYNKGIIRLVPLTKINIIPWSRTKGPAALSINKSHSTLRGYNTPGLVVHIYNPFTQEPEAGGSRIQGQPELHSETLSPNINK